MNEISKPKRRKGLLYKLLGKKFSDEEISWMIYDWGNSAYSMVITSTVFPLFFKQISSGQLSDAKSTEYLGYTNSITTLFLFLLSPILSTISEYKGFKKRLFVFFAYLGIFFTFLLTVIPITNWQPFLIFYILTGIGFSGANIFYDSFLIDVSTEENMDMVSSYGFAIGYIGSTIPFILSIAIIFSSGSGNISISQTTAMKISFLITALWWWFFTLPMIKDVKQKKFIEPEKDFIKKSFTRLWGTLKNIMEYKGVFIFLIAYFFYIDGVDTIITMATSFGSDMGIGMVDLLVALLITQFVAFPFAILYGELAKKYTAEALIMVAILIYIGVCIFALFMTGKIHFYILAIVVGTSQGGIQSLSRSYFGKIIPKEKSSQFFGFYNIFGKFAAILGPLLLSVTTRITGNSKYGVFSIIFLFLAGGIIFYFNSFKTRSLNQKN